MATLIHYLYTKEKKMKIKGYVLVGVYRDVDHYFSKSQKKFVDNVLKLNLSDLEAASRIIDSAEEHKIKQDYPLIDRIKGFAKIKIKIEL